MQFGMPTLIENKTLKDNITLWSRHSEFESQVSPFIWPAGLV